jgi:hypothetical protein
MFLIKIGFVLMRNKTHLPQEFRQGRIGFPHCYLSKHGMNGTQGALIIAEAERKCGKVEKLYTPSFGCMGNIVSGFQPNRVEGYNAQVFCINSVEIVIPVYVMSSANKLWASFMGAGVFVDDLFQLKDKGYCCRYTNSLSPRFSRPRSIAHIQSETMVACVNYIQYFQG